MPSRWSFFFATSVWRRYSSFITHSPVKLLQVPLSKEENIVKNERFLIYLHQGKYVNENQLLSLLQDPKKREMLKIQVQIRPLLNRNQIEYVSCDNLLAKEMMFVVDSAI